MKLLSVLHVDIDKELSSGLHRKMTADNIRRGRMLAVVAIVTESFFASLNIGAALLKVDERFKFWTYLLLYGAMLLMSALFLLLTNKHKTIDHLSDQTVQKIDRAILVYITLIMAWGSVVSLLDQPLYGQLVVFMANMLICSVVFLYEDKKLFLAYLPPVLIIAAGLPFFQPSQDVLIGHYVNLSYFIVVCYVISRIFFRSYYSDYAGRVMLERSNKMLERQIRQNELMNMQLEQVNGQLRTLSLYDELTGAANRRNFRDFINLALEDIAKNTRLSVIMLDIDSFKEYNDHYGHAAGDRLLIKAARQIRSEIKQPGSTFARWGGDEFLVASFDAGEEEIEETAENIRRKVYDLAIPHEFSPGIGVASVSCGVCTLPLRGRSDVSSCIELADKALYLAKTSGRNCTKRAASPAE